MKGVTGSIKSILFVSVVAGLAMLAGCDDSEHCCGGAVLAFQPLTVDFGEVPVGENRVIDLRVSNYGECRDIYISSVEFGGDAAEFKADLPDADEYLTIEPGDSVTIPVTYTPVDDVPDGAWLIINHNVATQNFKTKVPIISGPAETVEYEGDSGAVADAVAADL